MKFFLVVLFCSLGISAFAQNPTNYLDVITNATPNFTIDSWDDLEATHTINNCFTIRVRSKNAPCSIFAKVNYYSKPSGFTGTIPPVKMALASSNSTIYTLVNSLPVSLTAVNQLLFTQLLSNSVLNYNYNLIFGPLDYTFIPGSYVYYITLTMTQP